MKAGRKRKIFDVNYQNYMDKKDDFEVEEGTIEKLDEGVWLPTSVCAVLLKCKPQTVRQVVISQGVRVMRFKKGPNLTLFNDLLKYVRSETPN